MAGCFRQGGRLPARDDSDAPKQPFVIGVTGGTTFGKTTVCDMIVQQLHYHRVVLVNQDSFYRGLNAEELELVHEYNFDHPRNNVFAYHTLLIRSNFLNAWRSLGLGNLVRFLSTTSKHIKGIRHL